MLSKNHNRKNNIKMLRVCKSILEHNGLQQIPNEIVKKPYTKGLQKKINPTMARDNLKRPHLKEDRF